ncbi:MAG: 3-deoxy-manno-octulosonate cytidylyltransferase [Bacteroidetes bacterium]|nr:3-deoxy-manno-octulosonate cytidylyltransferase [Bacteroidota bacterium]
MRVLGIIPARYSSSRFPGKPLIDIEGKSMIQRVYEQSMLCREMTDIIVATDDERIKSHVEAFKGRVVLTSPAHQNGTERCAEVMEAMENSYDLVINIQGDEPFINPLQISALVTCFQSNPTVEIGTLKKKIDSLELLLNHGVVKVVCDVNQRALYFSRSPIPFNRNAEPQEWLSDGHYYKHIGIYGYLPRILKQIVKLPMSSLERIESLEQLRWMENGFNIHVAETLHEAKSIDTPEDLDYVLNNRELFF